MAYQPNNQAQPQAQGQQQDDQKVFARHVIIRPTKSGGDAITLFISRDEAEKLYADLGQALDLTAKNEAEGAKLSLVVGDGSNGKPYALVGISPTYPRAQSQGSQQAPQQAPRVNPVQPNAPGAVVPNSPAPAQGYQGRGPGNYNRGPAPGRPFSNKKL